MPQIVTTSPKPEKPDFINARERLIVALDVASADEARRIVSELAGAVGAFKIGLRLFTSAGPAFVRELVSAGEKIFLDLKFHDIPNTVATAAVEAALLGVWMLNVHCLGGREMMKRTAEAIAEVCERENLQRPLVIGVTLLTSMDSIALEEIGMGNDLDDGVLRLARLAADSGLDGVVASAKEARPIRSTVNRDSFVIVTPGIRPLNATVDDQKRVLTPAEAILSGSDYLVVGRPFLTAKDRKEAVIGIIGDIQRALDEQI